MKRSLAALLFLWLLAPSPAHAAWAHVDGCIAFGTTSASTASCTLANPLTAGALVVGCGEWASSSGLISSVSDGTNSYTLRAGTLLQNASDGWSRECFSLSSVASGPQTITVTFSSSFGNPTIVVDEYTGGLSSGAFDQGVTARQANPGTAANAVTSGNVTPTVDGELIYGYGGSSLHNAPVYTVGTGFTLRQRYNSRNPTSEDLVQATAAVIAATFTDNTASDNSFATVMTFKPAAAPVGGVKHLMLLRVGER